MSGFEDGFDVEALDLDVWVPHYLPQWSSRAASAAVYELAGSELRLSVPVVHGVWCEGDHKPPIRVSGVQSGVHSAQQPFEGAVLREEQETHWGWTPRYGLLEVRARMDITPRSMAAVWMAGIEDVPQRSAEICIFEVFGDALRDGSAAVGMGVHPFRDPAITDEFDAPRLEIDVSQPHVYTADWQPGRVDFLVDGEHVKTVHQAPDYPMQMMVAVFDFPAKGGPEHVPMFAVDVVRGSETFKT